MAELQELLDKQREMAKRKALATKEKESVINKVLTFNIGSQIYGIEIPYVKEIIGVPAITVVPGVPPFIKGIINVRSKVVPVVDVRIRFGKESLPYGERNSTIIVECNGISVGLIVDEVLDVLPIMQTYIAKTPDLNNVNTSHFISYILEMNDGIKLVLDVQKLIYEKDAV